MQGEALLSSIANINPFRYRGYYFDTETGLYYLISRYYDPETGRFISADSIEYLDPKTLGGLNLYAYCGNNPVMAIDPDGTETKWWEFWNWDWKKIGGWIVAGIEAIAAVSLIVLGSVISCGFLGAVLVCAGAGALIAMGGMINSQGGFVNADPWKVVKAGLIGGAIGAFSGAVSYGFAAIGAYIGESLATTFAHALFLGTEIEFGKVLGYITLATIGKFIGGIVGGLIGGTTANYFGNKFFGENLNLYELIKQGFDGEIPMWIINFFKSL